jgi:hypothetical protein
MIKFQQYTALSVRQSIIYTAPIGLPLIESRWRSRMAWPSGLTWENVAHPFPSSERPYRYFSIRTLYILA